jgi:hypothetical protein
MKPKQAQYDDDANERLTNQTRQSDQTMKPKRAHYDDEAKEQLANETR